MNETTHSVLQIGDRMPALTLTAIDGSEMRLSRYAGKKYILYMWASW
jgi:peroxiredoxin